MMCKTLAGHTGDDREGGEDVHCERQILEGLHEAAKCSKSVSSTGFPWVGNELCGRSARTKPAETIERALAAEASRREENGITTKLRI